MITHEANSKSDEKDCEILAGESWLLLESANDVWWGHASIVCADSENASEWITQLKMLLVSWVLKVIHR